MATRTVTREPYEGAAIAEKVALDERIDKLDVYRHSEAYLELSESERDRLTRQYCHMKDYSNVLGERISAM